MLENQLYKSATSLEAYLDRSTLKSRLGKLASAITAHYKQVMQNRRPDASKQQNNDTAVGGSANSVGSLPESIAPLPNLKRQISESVASSKTSLPIAPTAKIRREQSDSVIPSSSSSSFPAGASSTSSLPVPGGGLSGANINEGSINMPISNSLDGGNPLIQNNINVNNTFQNSNNNMALTNGAAGISALANQRATNEQLQQQILENIRQQQELVRRINGGNNAGTQNMTATAGQMSMMNPVGNGIGMMGGGVGMNPALNQQLQQQQQRLIMMQQQMRAAGGLGMSNVAAMQQQMMMANNNMNPMNMMNFSLPNVVPGGGGGMPSLQMNNSLNNMNNMPASRDNLNAPNPATANPPTTPVGNRPGSNDESSSLSPSSFLW